MLFSTLITLLGIAAATSIREPKTIETIECVIEDDCTDLSKFSMTGTWVPLYDKTKFPKSQCNTLKYSVQQIQTMLLLSEVCNGRPERVPVKYQIKRGLLLQPSWEFMVPPQAERRKTGGPSIIWKRTQTGEIVAALVTHPFFHDFKAATAVTVFNFPYSTLWVKEGVTFTKEEFDYMNKHYMKGYFNSQRKATLEYLNWQHGATF